MPYFNVKLASLSSSLKKSLKKVTTKLSLKKNKDGKKKIFFHSASETLDEIEIQVIAQPTVVVLPAEEPSRFLMVASFAMEDDDEEQDEDEDAEEITTEYIREFEAKKKVTVSVVPRSIAAAVSEKSKLCLHVQLIKSTPRVKGPPRLRSFNSRPSPLRNFFVAPLSFDKALPPLPIATTTGTITPPLSPSSSISSISSSSSSDGPSTPPRNASPTRSVVQKRVAEIEARCGRELMF